MALHGRQHIGRRSLLAVVELHALADLEGPCLGVVGSARFLGERWFTTRLSGDQLDELLAPLRAEDVGTWLGQRRVEAVGRRAALQAGLEHAALHRAFGSAPRSPSSDRCKGRAYAERGGAAEEVAARSVCRRQRAGSDMLEFTDIVFSVAHFV